MAWQSGMTGIGYDPKRVGKKITSWNDLQDPALKGKIGMFADNEDLPSAALFAVGVNPETSTEADWQKAADMAEEAAAAGAQVLRPVLHRCARRKGDIWASMAYSGDIFQANLSGATPRVRRARTRAPPSGPTTCASPSMRRIRVDAMTYMDFVYQPKIAAMLAEDINYITPVTAAQAVHQEGRCGGERQERQDV